MPASRQAASWPAGPYPTTAHAEIAGVDHFVLGEAEVTLPRFLEDLRHGRAERVYSVDGEARRHADRPAPRFDLLRQRDYAAMALQFSRGCPHACEFCDIVELFGHTPADQDAATSSWPSWTGSLRRRAGAGRSSSWTTTSSATAAR